MKRIKPYILLLIFFLLSLFPNALHTASAEIITQTEPRVYITETGEKFHNYFCSYLKNKRIAAVGLYQAQDAGYTACSRCKGTPNGTIEIEYELIEEENEDDLNPIWFFLVVGIIGAYDLYFIIFVIKNFDLSCFLDNFKKLRNWCLILVSCVVTFAVVFLLTNRDVLLDRFEPYPILGAIFLVELLLFTWLHALFSD